ncbi:hypothetical protein RRG08_061386 [Elysia crispata]|uniref:Uncharacterized protein n=1 Tax=Elysia crispata TaxID=231223 RepID=A0AAE1AG27_9GAST|nr:hypothetical protein RRG08_061386 [Elysia crispata]
MKWSLVLPHLSRRLCWLKLNNNFYSGFSGVGSCAMRYAAVVYLLSNRLCFTSRSVARANQTAVPGRGSRPTSGICRLRLVLSEFYTERSTFRVSMTGGFGC